MLLSRRIIVVLGIAVAMCLYRGVESSVTRALAISVGLLGVLRGRRSLSLLLRLMKTSRTSS
jgi:hypothetical protein